MGGTISKKSNKRGTTHEANGLNQPNLASSSSSVGGVEEEEEGGGVYDQSYGIKQNASGAHPVANGGDDFYDGIPRYTSSFRSRSTRNKVSEVGSRIGRAGTFGLEKAVEVLDNLSTSMTNLNTSSGFGSGSTTKGNELSILSFEVANTIVKGSNLMRSLSQRSMWHLKEVVLISEGVRNLISGDEDELLSIVASDKREELKVFLGEVIRFGNISKDPQWHNLDRYFEKVNRVLTPQKSLKEEAESVINLLMTLVHHTAELYRELQILDRIEQNYSLKLKVEHNSASNHKGVTLPVLKSDLKHQKNRVRNLKKKSLWSRSMEEVMEKLVDIVHFLLLEIHNTFRTADDHMMTKGFTGNNLKLGPAGLSLHYANVVMQIDNIVARSSSVPLNARETLYLSLPPSIKAALRSKLDSFHIKDELTVAEIKDEMEKTLHWLVLLSTNTAKVHHGFGWVGEWGNSGSEMNRKSAFAPAEIMQIETLYHADKEKTESYILNLLLWLHHLVIKSKATGTLMSQTQNTIKSSASQPVPASANTSLLTIEEQELLPGVRVKKGIRVISTSEDVDLDGKRLSKHDKLIRSDNDHPPQSSNDIVTTERLPSAVSMTGFGIDEEKDLDAIDRMEVIR